MYYVTDTHSFIWYLMDSPKLSQKAKAVFDACERGDAVIIIPAITAKIFNAFLISKDRTIKKFYKRIIW